MGVKPHKFRSAVLGVVLAAGGPGSVALADDAVRVMTQNMFQGTDFVELAVRGAKACGAQAGAERILTRSGR